MEQRTISRRNLLTGSALLGGAALAGTALVGGTATAAEEKGAGFIAGTYSASAQGRFGLVPVEVEFADDAIVSVTVGANEETAEIAGSALAYVPQAIVDGQTLAFDGIAGATFTCNAILSAVADCVKQAGGDPDALAAQPQAPASHNLTAGTYEVSAHGHHSDVALRVTLGASSIDAVEVVSEGETYHLSDAALNTLPQKIVDAQTTNVDVVSGATYTSRAIASAVEKALEQAGGVEAVRGFGERLRDEAWPMGDAGEISCDVVVVGSGMSGIAAALSAQEHGADVVLIDKLPYWGGVSQTCKGFFRLPYDGTDESAESYYQYGLHMHCGVMKDETVDEQYPDRALLHMLSYNNHDALKWLEGMGAQLEWLPLAHIQHMPEYFLGGCHFVSDDGAEAPDVTGMNFERLLAGFEERGGRILLECVADEVIMEGGRACGVTASTPDGTLAIHANAVVLAAGGFGNNPALVAKWAPSYNGERNVTLCGNMGDGILMGIDAGGAIWDQALMMGQFGQSIMTDYDMVHPYEDNETPSSSVFVNPQGLRVNSETPVAYSGGTSYVNPDPSQRDYYWAVTNKGILVDEPAYQAMLDEQLAAGNPRFLTADTLPDLARQMLVTPNTLRYTLNRYNRLCDAGEDTDFCKNPKFLKRFEDEGPWYAVKCPVVYFGTVGGLKINEQCAVLDEAGNEIPGLFAAGENANGGFFNLSYVGGRSMPVCCTTGRIAGASAAGDPLELR